MKSAGLITCRKLFPYLFVLLLTECLARKGLKQHEVPPTELDENGCECKWTPWMNNNDFDARVGDNTTYDNLRQSYYFCQIPRNIKCRSKRRSQIPYRMLRVRDTTCSVKNGLTCFSKPFDTVLGTKETPHLCEDFEITVQCCTCQNTTAPPENSIAITTAAKTKYNTSSSEDLAPRNIQAVNTEQNATVSEKVSSNDGVPVTMILIAVFGCVIIAGFIVVIWLVLTKTTFHSKKRTPDQNFYREGPADVYISATEAPSESTKVTVSFSRPSGSSDYLTTSSDDEGYRSRPSYNRKRKTKGQRHRKLNNSNKTTHGYASDSFEFPTLDSRPPTDDNSDEGRFRKWFPDEYERALQQKKRQQPVAKSRSIFNTPFNANNRKSIPYVDDES